ncbi:hypothetical protein TSUD_330360 [Trifolium subterraneum]|nr:hypothetical protein TSUD_330360 [Trifolium subterraneum]
MNGCGGYNSSMMAGGTDGERGIPEVGMRVLVVATVVRGSAMLVGRAVVVSWLVVAAVVVAPWALRASWNPAGMGKRVGQHGKEKGDRWAAWRGPRGQLKTRGGRNVAT